MEEFKVFYAWQSDLPNATTRGFIQDALERACKQVSNDPAIEHSPRVDQDTKDLAGSPLIPQAIMDKIDSCQAFVADVSLCFAGPDEKFAPNPNVVYELGYAVARLGWDRIVLVVNEEFGSVEKLPFDLEKRRAVPYTAKEGESDRSEAKKALIGRLVANVEAISKRQPIVPKRTAADIAIEAVEDQVPARKARIRDFWAWIFAELRRLEPDLRSRPPTGEHLGAHIEALKSAVANAGPVARAWSQVCEAIALSGDSDCADALTRGFSSMLEEYDNKPDWGGGTFNETWFDYWRFSGHEFFTVWIGCLLKERQWSLIGETLSHPLYWEQHERLTGNGLVFFDEFSDFVRLFGEEGNRNGRLSIHADVLKERYGSGGIGSVLRLQDFIDAELFLFLAADFRVKSKWSSWCHWRPWSVLYMKHQPRFLIEGAIRQTATGINAALGAEDSDTVKARLKEFVPKLRELWPGGFWHSPLTAEVIDSFDSRD